MRVSSPWFWTIVCGIAFGVSTVQANELADITLAAGNRRFTSANPRQKVEQEFAIPAERGILTITYMTDPYPLTASLGGFDIYAKGGTSLYLGRTATYQTKPKTLQPGARWWTQKVILVDSPITKGLVAQLVAHGVPQAIQIVNEGDQLASTQNLKVDFVSMSGAANRPGSPPEVDIAGKWKFKGYSGGWTFTPRSDGTYDAVEDGFGFGRGIAKVTGRTVTITWENTKPYGEQKNGVHVVEVGSGGNTMTGAWITNNGENNTSEFTRTTPAPTKETITKETPTKDPDKDTGTKDVGTKTGPTGSTPTEIVPEPANVQAMTLQAGKRRVQAGETVTIPVYLLKAHDVANLNVTVSYDPAVAKTTGAFSKGNMLDKALFELNPKDAGIVRIGFAQNADLNGDGTIANVTFTATGPAGASTPLRLNVTTSSSVGGTKAAIATIDGEIVVTGPGGIIPGDSDRDGVLTARDAANALKMSVNLIPVDMSCDMDGDRQVTSTDARLILSRASGKR